MLRYVFVFIVFFCGQTQAADAPYVTTPQNVIDAMLQIAAVKADDVVFDLGAGDGRIVITAAKQFGARGTGIELDPNLVRTATRDAQREGVQDRVSFISDDLFFADLSKASVITMYMSEAVNLRLRPSLFKLKPGTRVVSHDFDMGNWQPDNTVTVPVPGKRYGPPLSRILMWTLPADFSGKWSWQLAVNDAEAVHEAVFTQKFQTLAGRGRIAARQAVIGSPQIRGDAISFVMGAEVADKATWREFQGRINGDTIAGTAVTIADADKVVVKGAAVAWRATRIARGALDIEAGAQPFASGSFTRE